jgi:glyoxylase-like metal-dependent hydrolase (beta-lactamase superfamily II)/rhodanese-related sulfurtransferase
LEEVPTITVARLQEMLERGDPVAVLDVRPADERHEWFIPNSLHVDAYDDLKAGDMTSLAAAQLPGDRPVVAVCAHGNTSKIATAELKRRGFDALSLEGGMRAWSLAWNSAEVSLPGHGARIVQLRRTGKGCLSYLIIGSDGEAAVIDPSLEPEVYVQLAKAHATSIAAVLDTHVHADHWSRAWPLAELTGATYWLPPTDRVSFSYSAFAEGRAVDVGGATIEAIHTPGHTPESTSYRVGDALFTGDTLFLSAVGRPDLETDAAGARTRAHELYRSLGRVRELPPDTIVLAGHTSEPIDFDRRAIAGTLEEIVGRLDILKLTESEFVAMILDRIPPTPPNHHRIVELNESGRFPDADPTELEAGANRCAIS